MKKINIAIIGYGNIGKYAKEAIESSEDLKLVGIVRRDIKNIPEELKNIPVVTEIKELEKVDVALLCVPSRLVPETAKYYLSLGINTVDSFDIHRSIKDLRNELNDVCIKNNKTAIISAGWDPGIDSMIRGILLSSAPKGITYTNFGPGMSMGHTVACKAIKGVKDALSITIPKGSGLHRRDVYIEINEGENFEEISKKIKEDDYFKYDETHVILTLNINELMDKGHGVNMMRKGVSGETQNQLFEFSMKINNPALTSQIMVSCARASLKQKPGAYTMIELPIIDLLEGNRDDLIEKLV